MIVRGVNDSRSRLRYASSVDDGSWARNTSPDDTACIGTRDPVQSRILDLVGSVLHLVDVVDDDALGDREARRLAGLGRELLEDAAGPSR